MAEGVLCPVSVASTIARRNIGVTVDALFREGVHKEKDREWDEDEGVWRAKSQMRYYLKKVSVPAGSQAFIIYDMLTPTSGTGRLD